PMIIGTDSPSIEQLIEQVNNDPRRGKGHDNALTRIDIDESTLAILGEKKLTLHSVKPKVERLFVNDAAHLSSGGTAEDVTDIVHPQNRILAERAARLLNLDVCGIDIIAEDIRKPVNDYNGAVIEVNAGPGLRMHLTPEVGTPRNVAAPIVD